MLLKLKPHLPQGKCMARIKPGVTMALKLQPESPLGLLEKGASHSYSLQRHTCI